MPTHQPDDTSIVSDNNDDEIFLPKKKRLDPRIVLSGIMMFILVSSSGLALVAQNRDTDNRSSASEGEYSNTETVEPCIETPGNLVINPSFESNLNGWKKGKFLQTSVIRSTVAHCKKAAQLLLKSDFSSNNSQLIQNALTRPIIILPNTTYKISYWAKYHNANSNTYASIETLVYDDTNPKYGSEVRLAFDDLSRELTSEWKKFEFTGKSISQFTGNGSRLYVYLNGKGRSVDIDNIVITAVPDPSPTFEPTPTASQSAQKRVFVTSTMYDGDLGGADGADMKCQASAEAAGLGSKWKAWLSDSSSNPNTRFMKSSTGYQLLNGVEVARDWDGLNWNTRNENLLSPINVTEYGDQIENPELNWDVWTNTSQNGYTYDTQNHLNCNGFTSASSEITGVGGSSQKVTYEWSRDFSAPQTQNCSVKNRLYCFEQ